MLFTKETPILYYEARSHQRWLNREYILFPAYYYRVLAPRVSSRKLNILEKAVLGICRIGAFTAQEIGEKLDIGGDLSALIISELQYNNFIDHQGLITKKGKQILEDELIETEDLIAGYVFQEPWQGELFPRFIENLEYAETRFNDNDYPELVLGTTGKPFYQKIFMPLPINNTLMVKPTPRDILRAIKTHNQTLTNRHRENDVEANEQLWNIEKQPDLKRISFIEEQPQPVWLATFIYTPESNFDEFTENNWQISDPFGLGDSPWLYRQINKCCQKQDNFPLQKSINNLLNSNTKLNESKERQEKRQDLMIYHEEAINIIENKLSLEILKWDDLYKGLIVIERTYLELELSSKNKQNINYINYFINDKLEDIVIKCQKLLENIFLIIGDQYPTEKCWEILDHRDKEYNKIILEQIVEKIGFKPLKNESHDSNLKLPKSLLSVDINKIKSASDYQNGSLRGYIIASLLTAYNYEQHPLYFFAEKMPTLLFELDKLADLRNKSGHYSSQKLTQEIVKKQIALVYQLIELFLQKNFHKPIELEEKVICV
ncbi:hypothetical protein WEU38_14585 [Cyanobacterium aponinum AL20118]|uniref:Uncharacterized protein n=1 Tax=Cyanobacterium aponinum AL20115 TaxID=3090662 RepID=A0AAF0ZEX2_9CHRO|nr:hypothetical protein [Cyanobacterium aponinum]WPF88024.1 hypothetical protein SAY89_14655 [Cyanobacterium aponinum AL20115]